MIDEYLIFELSRIVSREEWHLVCEARRLARTDAEFRIFIDHVTAAEQAARAVLMSTDSTWHDTATWADANRRLMRAQIVALQRWRGNNDDPNVPNRC